MGVLQEEIRVGAGLDGDVRAGNGLSGMQVSSVSQVKSSKMRRFLAGELGVLQVAIGSGHGGDVRAGNRLSVDDDLRADGLLEKYVSMEV